MKKLSILFLILLTSCATKEKQEIDSEMAHLPKSATSESIAEHTRKMLEGAPLTEEQKDKFVNLHSEVWSESQAINEEIKKLKIILFRSLVSKDYNRKKIEIAKIEIKKLYNKKLDIMIGALEDARKILGKNIELPTNAMWFERIHFH